MFSKRPEICSIVRKLLKICQGWVDTHAVGAYGQYGDELKIKKNVLTDMYPDMCDRLTTIFGTDPDVNYTCAETRRMLVNAAESRQIFELLHKYAKENLLWLNVYVKDSFAKRIIRDESMTRTSFVANVGGLLGLCMGFSMVSIAEILYFLFKRNNYFCNQVPRLTGWTKSWKEQNRRKSNNIALSLHQEVEQEEDEAEQPRSCLENISTETNNTALHNQASVVLQ